MLSIDEVAMRVSECGIDPQKFWELAMGGEMAPLPDSVVDRLILQLEEEGEAS
jgi:hypothetical protein